MQLHKRLAICVLAGLFSFGCGDSGFVKARGRVIKGGAPFQLPEGEGLRIVFSPMELPTEQKYDSYAAAFDPDDSTFFVMGKGDKGLPPGNYRISIELLRKKEDLLGGKLLGKNSPLTCEIVAPANDLVIDLDKANFDTLLEQGAAKASKRSAKKSRG
jgi:hypothetical protein